MSSSIKQALGASAAITITLASLATDTSLLAGRQSTAIVNTNNYLDYLVAGKITTGTSPTAAKSIEVWVYGSENDTPLYPDTVTGTDGNLSLTSRDIAAAGLRLGAFLATDNTTARTYWFAPFSVAALFGGVVPTAWGIWVVHNTGVSLNSTGGNHAIYYTPAYSTIT